MTLFLSSLVIAAPLTAPERPVFPFRLVAGEDGDTTLLLPPGRRRC